MTPVSRAVLAACLAVVVGLALSALALRLGLIDRVLWPAAAGVAVMVAGATYVRASRPSAPRSE